METNAPRRTAPVLKEKDMPHGNYNRDDVHVCFDCEMERERSDIHGVPDTWEVNPDTVKVLTVTILGVDVNPSDLPADLRDAILSLYTQLEFDE
jgi:hypothetical protein